MSQHYRIGWLPIPAALVRWSMGADKMEIVKSGAVSRVSKPRTLQIWPFEISLEFEVREEPWNVEGLLPARVEPFWRSVAPVASQSVEASSYRPK